MLTDALLALIHHLAAFSLVSILAIEWLLLRPGITATQLRAVGKLDQAYGGLAGLLLAVGFSRTVWGAKGWAFYAGNPVFWAKVGVFVLIGLLSTSPTIALVKWRRTGMPTDAQISQVRRWLNAELLLIALLPVFAALMARGIGT
jgi:putative membrane protein